MVRGTWLRGDVEISGRPTGFRARARGCLLGGAVGDALGTPIKNLSLDAIHAAHGPLGVQSFLPAFGKAGAVSAITQMTLFTAEGIIRAHVRQQMKGMCHPPSVVAHAYARWLVTQGGRPQTTHEIDNGWLVQRHDLHHRRGPSETCMAALQRDDLFGNLTAPNRSKGAAALTRIAPVAFATDRDGVDGARSVFQLAVEIAAITHGHWTAWCAAGAFTVVVHALLWGYPLEAGIARARLLIGGEAGHQETEAVLDLVVTLVAKGTPTPEVIVRLGRGQLAHEALGLALFCALTAQEYEDGVLAAVNSDGDSDAAGALTGQLLGASLGETSIPDRWLGKLECRREVETIANDLAEFLTWDIGEGEPWSRFSEDVWRHYPGS